MQQLLGKVGPRNQLAFLPAGTAYLSLPAAAWVLTEVSHPGIEQTNFLWLSYHLSG